MLFSARGGQPWPWIVLFRRGARPQGGTQLALSLMW
jgi:hypothetical protein